MTLRELFYGALEDLGARGVDSAATLTANSETSYLRRFNAMLAEWQIKKVVLPVVTQTTLSLTPGKVTYTIGATGDLNVARPVDVLDTSFVRNPNSLDLPMRKVSRTAFEAITLKSAPGIPYMFYYDAQFPLGILNLYPVCNLNGYVAYLDLLSAGTAITDVAAALNIPPEFLRCARLGFACEIAMSATGSPPPAWIKSDFDKAFSLVRSKTSELNLLVVDSSIRISSGVYNINRGY